MRTTTAIVEKYSLNIFSDCYIFEDTLRTFSKHLFHKSAYKFTQVVIFGLLLFMACFQAMAQKPILPAVPTACDYSTAPANITLMVGTEPAGFSKNYLLVDMTSGAIVATNPTAPSFTSVPQGLYYATTAYYTSGASIHNDVVGKLISQVYVDGGPSGSCLKYATAVGIKVCTATCDYNTAPATIAFTASPSPTAGVTTTYALVDETNNKIVQTSSSASFSSVGVGSYSVVGVYSTGAFTLAVGDTLYNKTTNDVNCVGVSNTIHFKVCSSVCLAGTTVPDITPATATNTCPITTVSLAGLANAGTKPAGTTLIWSTHKLPTSAGDTLTNTTTVSTAGKYYALYFDKVNNCYSPADSVTISFTTCSTPCVAGTTAPAITQTTLINTCPTTTANLGSLTNTGTKPAGTTLIWSMSKVPTSAGDTLSNLNVSTAGKYYALYFDKVNSCYSPADSVTVSFISCLDSDGDGVADIDDLDDDNDGILDITECNLTNKYLVGWTNNPNPVTGALAGTTDPELIYTYSPASAANQVFGSGLTQGVIFGSRYFGNVDATTLAQAITNNEYVEYGFTTGTTWAINKLTQIDFGRSVFPNDGTTYQLGILISDDNFATSTTLVSSYSTSSPSSSYTTYTNLVNYPLLTNKTYKIRVYFFGNNSIYDFDDFRLKGDGTCDTDGDGIANALDLDSDGDGCPDAIEGGGNFTLANLVTSTMLGGNSGGSYTGTSTSPVVKNLGNTVGNTPTTLGVPTIATTGQTVGNSLNGAVQSANCTPCAAGTTAPALSGTTITNTCPATFVNLNSLHTGTAPAGSRLRWHTVAINPTPADSVANANIVITNGTYYAYYFDATNNCYSPASAAVVVTINTSCLVDRDGDGIVDTIDIDDDNDGVKDIDEECIGYLAQNTTGAWLGNTTSTLTATYTGMTAQTLVQTLNDDQIKYHVNSNSGEQRLAKAGAVSLTYTFSPAVQANEIAFMGIDVESPAAQMTFSVTGGATTGDFQLTNLGFNSPMNYNNSTGVLTFGSGGANQNFMLKSNSYSLVSSITFTVTGSLGSDLIAYSLFARKDCDTDGDGTPNKFDPDSDNDNCSDAFEASATTNKTTNYAFTGAVGTNGLDNSLETGTDNGTINYSSTYNNYAFNNTLNLCIDSDNDSIADIIDLDDDNDGILDTVEIGTTPLNYTNGSFTGNATGWTFTGSGAGYLNYNGGGIVGAAECTTGTSTFEQNLSCTSPTINSLTFKFGWNNGVGVCAGSTSKNIAIKIGGVTYATIRTPSDGGIGVDDATDQGGDAIITATNGASFVGGGSSLAINHSTYLSWTLSNITLNLPAGISNGSVLVEISNSGADDTFFDDFVINGFCDDDTDKDGIVNRLDLDSDGDGCPDAIEGGGNFTLANLATSTMPGGNAGGSYTGTSTSPVVKNLGNTVGSTPTTLGVPTIATTGQTVGNSANGTVQSANCNPCVAGINAPIITQTTLTNACPATTADLGSLTNTGTKPAGTTLVWSTNKIPTSAGDTLSNLNVSTAGKYYALYFDKVNNCYSPADSVTALISNCGNFTNTCPDNFVNLMAHVDSTNKPAGSTITWHTGTPATLANKVSHPTSVITSGTYYVAYMDNATACFGPTSSVVNVTINPCPALVVTNTCPVSTVDLMAHVDSTNKPAGAKITWHTGTPATAANLVSNPSTVSTSGMYYVSYFDVATACYGPSSNPVTVNITICCVPPTAPVLSATTKSNICPATTADITTLQPTAAAGTTLEWHTVASNPTAGDLVSTPNSVGVGTYYLYAKASAPANCYSPASQAATVTIAICCTAPAAPVLSSTAAQSNSCPITTVDLTSLQPTPAPGTTLEWHSVATNPTAANLVTMPVTGSGTYYLYAVASSPANCYSPASAGVPVTILGCTACLTPVVITASNTPTTCGANDGSIVVTGLLPSSNYTFNYKKDGGAIQSAVVTSDLLGKATIANLGIGSYTDIQVALPCASNKVATTVFAPASCISPIITPQDSTVTVCTPLADLSSNPNTTATACAGYPKVLGATATVAIVSGEVCITYKPKPGYVGKDSVCVTLCDPATSVCTTIKVPVTVQPVPLAINDINITLVNTPVDGTVATNDKLTASTDGFIMIMPPQNAQTFVMNTDGTYSYVPNPNFVGKDSVQYQVCSTLGHCSTAWLYITVYGPSIAVNAPPIAQNDVAQTNVNVPVLGNLGTNDFDPEKGPLVYSTIPVTNPMHGTVVIAANGTYTYTPTPGFIGTDKFTYQVCDELNQCTMAEVTIYVRPDVNGVGNDAPNAQDDSYRTPMNTPITANIRLNDSDPNGNVLTTSLVSTPSHGTVTLSATGGMTYTPAAGFYGNDSFTYRACDPAGLCDTATVYFVIEPPLPMAQNDINVTFKDKPVSGNILTNDNGGGLALVLNTTPVVPPSNGTIVINPNGTYTYTPNAGFVGTDSVRYVVCSASMVCDTAWLKINVIDPKTGVNNPPVANDDVAQTFKNTPVSGKVTNNDLDPDGNPLMASVVKQPDNGTLVLNPDGTFTYTPNPNFTGKDKFQYQVCDNAGACDTACLVITVTPDLNGTINDKPNAQDDAALTNINTKVTGSLKTNDSDPNGNNLTYTTTPILAPTNGTVSITATGSYTYTPAPGFYGTDQFTYKVCDSGTPTLCDTATVYIVVLPPTPDAQNDINVTIKNKTVTGNTSTNDSGNGIPFTTNSVLTVQPVHGTLTLATNGDYTYTPALNYVGKDSAQYVICNAANKCDTAWIYVSILPDPLINGNNPPIAQNDVAQTLTGVPVSGKVTNNDLDPDGNPLLASLVSNPSHGTLVFNPDGTFAYTPDAGFVGTDKFCYKVCDPSNACDTACVTITVSPDVNGTANDKPNAQDDAAITTVNTPVTGLLKPNDSDPNGNLLTYTSTPVVAPMHGTVTINPTTGLFVYTPTAGYTGTDKFLYKVCDNGVPSLCDTATVYLTVVPATKVPDAINDIALTFKNTPVSGNVLTNDNPNGFVVTTSLVTPAKNGTLTLLPNGTYTYVPNANFVGKDSARYVLCNILNVCDTAWVSINVMPYPPSSVDNNKPVASNDVSVTNMNVPVTGSVGNNDFDPDVTQTLTFTKLTDPTPAQGSVTFNNDGTYTFTPALDFVGNAMFTYKVCDNGSPVKCDTASVTIEVKPQSTQPNDKPIANDDAFVTYKGVGINGNAAPNDSDPNGNTSGGVPLVFSKVSNPTNGTVIMNANGTFSYAPNATFIGTDSFTYKICDNGTPSLCDTATVYLTVLPPKQPDATKPDAVNDIAITLKNTPVSGNVLTNDDAKGNPVITGLVSGNPPKHGVVTLNPNGSYTYTPTTGYVGKDSVKYVLCVNEIPLTKCDTAYIYFNVMDVPTPQNDKPLANNDVANTPTGTPVSGNVLNNDVDPDLGDILTASPLTNPAHGTLVLNPNGSYTYTPTPGYVGKDYFTYKVCDNGTPVKCDTAKVEIDVTPNITPANTNTKPSAQDDALLTKINTPKSGTVAPNDTDPNAGQTLVFSQLSNPANGTITGFNPTTGAYTYTPTAGFVGNDSFKYKVCDNGTPVLCDSATVIITVEPDNKLTSPVAQNDIAITSPNTPVKGNVLTNDDGKGNPLTAGLLTSPKNGTLVFNPDGSYTYTPNPNYVGRDSVKYKVCNTLIPVQCDSAWLYINTVPFPTAGNDKPVAMPDNVVTQQGSPVTSSVLGNDYDPDLGQILTASLVTNPTPAQGTVTMLPNGTYTFTPDPAFVGTVVFKYKVCDNGTPSLCDTTTVTIKVLAPDPTVPVNANLKPDAGDDVVVSTGGKPVTTTVISNDRDPNAGQILTYTLLNQPTKGTVTLSPTGTLVWNPVLDPAMPYATYTVKYRVCDNGSPVLCDTATVELKVQPSVTQPDAQDDIAVVRVNTPVTGNVLTNDDKRGLPVVPVVTTPAKNGTFVLNPVDGSYTYTPNPSFVGKDSVQYKICNNAIPVECDSAWVTFNVMPDPAVGVNDKPVASNDVTQTNAGLPVSGNVSTNDFDPDNGQTLTFTKLTNPTNGTATMNPNGTFTYTPNPGFVGTDVFKYKVCDNGTPVLCDTAKVIITVQPATTNPAVNQAPVAVDDAILGTVGKPVTYNVGGNDRDPEGTPLVFTKLGGNPNVMIDALGNVTYTPQIDPITGQPLGGNTVTYKVCDAGSPVKCDTATIYLTVAPSPTQPLAVNDLNNTLKNTPVTGTVLTNDDTKGLPVTATLLTSALHGTLTLNPNGTYGYIPANNFTGKDSVQYQICNNQTPVECSKAWLYINVAPAPTTANDKPLANPDVAQTLVNTPVTGKVTNNDTDPEGGVLTVTTLTNPTNGTLLMNPDGTFTYTPNAGFTGKDKFTYKVCDAGTPVLCDTASVTIDVLPKLTPIGGNDKPFAQDDAISTNINTAKSASVAPNDSDPNAGQTLAFSPVTNPAHGAVTMNSNGSYTYTPTTGYTGPDKFTYKVCDNGTPSLCDTATVYINVLPLPVPTATAPLAINDINITPKDTPATGNVLTNDDKQGLPVTASVLIPPTNGTIVLNPNGTYTYTPTPGFVGKDSVQYQVCNNKVPAECDVAWLYLYVQDAPTTAPLNNKPTAIADVNQTPMNLPVSGNVSTNDFDPDLGQTLAFTKLTNPTNGTVVFNANGTYTYTPNTGFIGTDVFTYKVCDNQTPALCDQTSVTIKVTPDNSGGGNIKPVANDDAYTTNKGIGITKNASLNDNDPNAGQTLTYTLLSIPANGTVTFNPSGTFNYAPSATFVGTDKFMYKVCDNGTPSLCDTATVYVTVKEPLVNVCVNFNLKVMLEGPLDASTGLMSNLLNQRGLLPGQTPIGLNAIATPNLQPYTGAPWNYAGTEVMPIGGYAADIVDWVLVSLRSDSLSIASVLKVAGLLHADGSVTFVNPCFTIPNGSYYVLVEHRNHMGVMSDKKVTVTSGTLTYDFTTKDSYAQNNPPTYGQKVKGGKYVMYAAEHKKALQNDNFDINAADSNLWKGQSGIFDRYMSGDYNFDADVNNADNTLWKINNGRFSGVLH
jgi:Bacterial Ig domain/Bacterial cadherin-like domain